MAIPYSDDMDPMTLKEPVEVDGSSMDKLVEKSPKLVVDCWAPWCGPCRMVAPVIEELASEMSGSVVFAKLNTDENQETAMKYMIRGIPTMLVFKAGKLEERIVGALPKKVMKEKIESI